MLLELSIIKVLGTIGVLIGLFVGFIIGLNSDLSDKTIKFIGIIISLFLAHYIKNPVSVFFYSHLPFFKFAGPIEGVTSFNILIYEFLAFLVVFILLLIVLRILMIFTKIFDKLVDFVLSIGIPSGIITGLVGFVVTYIILFVIVYFGMSISAFAGNKSDETLLDKFIATPVLNDTIGRPLGSMLEIANATIDYPNPKDLNYHALDILIKNKVISIDNAKNLIEDGKIDIPNSGKIIAKYEKK